jgi:hypothetical protein
MLIIILRSLASRSVKRDDVSSSRSRIASATVEFSLENEFGFVT